MVDILTCKTIDNCFSKKPLYQSEWDFSNGAFFCWLLWFQWTIVDSPRLRRVQRAPGSCWWIPVTSPPTCWWDPGSSPPLCRQNAWTFPPPYAPSPSSCPLGSAVCTFSPVRKWTWSDIGTPPSSLTVLKKSFSLNDYLIISNVYESDIQLSGRVASLQVAADVDVVVSDDASDEVRCGDALCPLSGHKHAFGERTDTGDVSEQWRVTADRVTSDTSPHPLPWCACKRPLIPRRCTGCRRGPRSRSVWATPGVSDRQCRLHFIRDTCSVVEF